MLLDWWVSYVGFPEIENYYLAYCECLVQCVSEDQFTVLVYLLCMLVFSALNGKRETRRMMLLPAHLMQLLPRTLSLQEPLIPGQDVWEIVLTVELLAFDFLRESCIPPPSHHVHVVPSCDKRRLGKDSAPARVFFLAARKILSSLLSLFWIRGAPRREGSQEGSSGWMNHPVVSFEAQIVLLGRGGFC